MRRSFSMNRRQKKQLLSELFILFFILVVTALLLYPLNVLESVNQAIRPYSVDSSTVMVSVSILVLVIFLIRRRKEFTYEITDSKASFDELMKNTEWVHAVFHSAEDCIFVKDKELRYIHVNAGMEKLFEKPAAELVGKSDYDLFDREAAHHIQEVDRRVLAGETIREEHSKKVNGIEHTFHVIKVPLKNNRGEIIGLCGIARDITEQTIKAKALKESEDRYRALVELSPEAIIVHQEGKIVFANKASVRLLGGTEPEDIIGKSVLGFVHPDYREVVKNRIKEILTHGGTTDLLEEKIVRLDGTVIDAEIIAAPIYHHGAPAIQVIGRDVTKRKQAEEALKTSEAKYRHLFEAAPDGVNILDSKGYIVDCNEKECALYGYSREELIGKHFSELLTENSKSVFHEKFARLQQLQSAHAEIEVVKKDGSIVYISRNGEPLIDEQGNFIGVLGYDRDITKQKLTEKELRKEKDKAQTYLDLAGVIFVALNTAGEVTLINNKGCEILGYAKQEILGKNWFDTFLQKEIREKSKENFKKLMAGEIALTEYYEAPLVTKEGKEKIIAWHNALLTDENNRITGTLSSGEDITERKLAEKSLKETKERIEQWYRLVPSAVFTVDADGIITSFNDRAAEITGYSPEEVIGKKCTIFAESPCQEGCILYSRGVEKPIFRKECTIKRKDGIVRTISKNADIFYDADGNYIGGVESFEDITERKLVDDELRKLSAAVIQSANSIVITNTDGIIEYVNPQFIRMTGYKLTEVVGKSPRILKSGKHDDEFYANLWKTITSGNTWTGNIQNKRKNGELYWERKTITPIFDENGSIINFLSIGEDITHEILTQQKLAEADKMSAVGMLAAGIAHEFKNYLAGIIGNASFALTELEDEGGIEVAQETLSKIVELGEKANDVAMSLLSYSKANPEDFSREDLKKVIMKSLSLVEKEMKNLSIEIVTYFDDDVPEVNISTSKIQQLLLNLLINAQHAIKSDGVITIALLREGDHVLVRVGDTGMGIPEKNLKRIFDPFFSTKGVWGKDELVGTGMGLAICRNIAREHGGDLTVDSIVGSGTTFTLSLPIKSSATESLQELSLQNRQISVLIFTLDKSIVSHFFQQACEVNAKLITIDNIANLPDNLSQVVNLVICDAKFTGKVELYKMVDICRQCDIPYVMVNCGTMEYQLAELYENARANFKQLPDFARIISCSLTGESHEMVGATCGEPN